MYRNKILFLLVIQFLCASLFCQEYAVTKNGKKIVLNSNGTWVYYDSLPLNKIIPTNVSRLELPRVTSNSKLIEHFAYTLFFDEEHKIANWVAYELDKYEVDGVYSRTDNFISDPLLKNKTATDKDYSHSGFDRGHMAPASDMKWSSTAMEQSFYYSNIAPQVPGFNRGIWKRLEEQVRDWAAENNKIFVVTGVILSKNGETIGKNRVAVPKYFYKAILDYSLPDVKAIAFCLPNEYSSEPIYKYAISVDSLEKLTGNDFYYQLPDKDEDIIEENLCISCWFDGNQSIALEEKQNASNSASAQCKGITLKGEKCKNRTSNQSGFCYLHISQDRTEIPQSNSNSREIITGPRGGKYYINKNGNKTYIRK